MSAQVFRRRMNDQINTHTQRLASPGRGEGVVNNHNQIVALAHFNHRRNVTDLQVWIGDCFNVEDFGVVLDSSLIR